MRDIRKVDSHGNPICKKCDQMKATTRITSPERVMYYCDICKEAVANKMRRGMEDKFEDMNENQILQYIAENGVPIDD